MEWFLRYGDEAPKTVDDVVGDTNTTTHISDTDLVQDTDFWVGGWFYDQFNDGERLIIASSSGGNVDLEWPLSNIPTQGYEIYDGWPPSVIHNAMNRAIRHAWRFWPDVVEADLVHTERLDYGLAASDFNNNGDPGTNDFFNVAEVLQVWLEVNTSFQGNVITRTNATVFTDTLSEWTTDGDGNVVDSDWFISVYEGVGAGELRQLNTWDTDGTFTVDTDWTVTLDTTSKWRAWNPSTASASEWYRIFAARFDQVENPNRLQMIHRYPAAYGLRLRILYIAQSSDFGADSDETRVPLEYMQYKTMSMLFAEMVSDNRYDRAANAGQAEYYGQMADDLTQKDTPTQPAGTLWQEQDVTGYGGGDDRLNPLDWNR